MGADTADQGWVSDGIGHIYSPLFGFRSILGSADGDSTGLPRGPADEAVNGLLGDEEGHAAFRFIFEGSLENEGIDELENEEESVSAVF